MNESGCCQAPEAKPLGRKLLEPNPEGSAGGHERIGADAFVALAVNRGAQPLASCGDGSVLHFPLVWHCALLPRKSERVAGDAGTATSCRLQPHYSRRFVDLNIDHEAADYPVTVRMERTDAAHAGQIETVRARYVVGCDGARSAVRKSIGRQLVGDSGAVREGQPAGDSARRRRAVPPLR